MQQPILPMESSNNLTIKRIEKTVCNLPMAWGCAALSVLGDVSAILFGVFGIWLGMFYRPDICDAQKGKSGAGLTNTCKQILSNAKRFGIVFRGMKTSAAVLVFSMIARTLREPIIELVTNSQARFLIKYLVFYGIYWAVLFQAYAIVMAIVPMMDAKRKMDQARDNAESTLSA